MKTIITVISDAYSIAFGKRISIIAETAIAFLFVACAGWADFLTKLFYDLGNPLWILSTLVYLTFQYAAYVCTYRFKMWIRIVIITMMNLAVFGLSHLIAYINIYTAN